MHHLHQKLFLSQNAVHFRNQQTRPFLEYAISFSLVRNSVWTSAPCPHHWRFCDRRLGPAMNWSMTHLIGRLSNEKSIQAVDKLGDLRLLIKDLHPAYPGSFVKLSRETYTALWYCQSSPVGHCTSQFGGFWLRGKHGCHNPLALKRMARS